MADLATASKGELLRSPPPDARSTSRVGAFMDWLGQSRALSLSSYEDLWRWSIDDLPGFWISIWEYFDVEPTQPTPRPFEVGAMPGASWFPGVELNYARYLLDSRFPVDKPAVVEISQTRERTELTFGGLADLVARARAGLRRLGVNRGDVVAGYLPNINEALVAFLATASLGAIWTSCSSEFGERSVIDRFGQILPKVLFAAGGYRYGTKIIDRRSQVASIVTQLPSVNHVIDVAYGDFSLFGAAEAIQWSEFIDDRSEHLEFESLPFDHPLFVLYSSGTTGLPKAIVHGHGGILLEHLKNHALSWDIGPADRMMWFTTTAWMMWNALISSLLTGASIVLLDGNPLFPDLNEQWKLAAQTNTTVLGLNPGFIMACRKASIDPHVGNDMSNLRELCCAGSPLPPEGAGWIAAHFGEGVLLNNGSGGTDVCTGIVQGNPLLPVWAGEISGRCLAVASDAFDEDAIPVIEDLGELVITKPMPSMPVRLWGDDGGERLQSTYFEVYPGVWRQGDWIRFTDRGSCEITGRSDATLNRGGVRLGTGEFYRAIENIPEVAESLVVHLEGDDGGIGRLVLFVVLADNVTLDETLRRHINERVISQLSPRHRPDEIVQMPGVPRSLTGKLLELPVKKILMGAATDDVASRDALADPLVLDAYAEYASRS